MYAEDTTIFDILAYNDSNDYYHDDSQSPFRMVYMYFLEGVTQPSCAHSDTILPVGYNVDFTDNMEH